MELLYNWNPLILKPSQIHPLVNSLPLILALLEYIEDRYYLEFFDKPGANRAAP